MEAGNSALLQKLLEYKAETLPPHTFGYVEYKNVIKWNFKNALLCSLFADPVTFSYIIGTIMPSI